MTDWTPYTMTITGSTTNPTKGTTATDQAYWRRVGDQMEIRYEYSQTAAGSAGSGNYLFALPAGYTADTSTKASLPSSGGQSLGSGTAYDGTNYRMLAAALNDSTHLYLVNPGTSTPATINSSNNSLANTQVRFGFEARMPISGWSTYGP